MLFLLLYVAFCFLFTSTVAAQFSSWSRAFEPYKSEREARLSRFHSGEMGPLSILYPLSHLWQLTLLKVLAADSRTAYNYMLPPYFNATRMPYEASKLLAPSTTGRRKARLGSRCHHASNADGILLVTAAATATPARHMSRSKEKSSGYCSQAGHLHSTVCSDRDRRGPCTLPSSGAPEGSSAPEARSHPCPAPQGLEALLWVVSSTQDAGT